MSEKNGTEQEPPQTSVPVPPILNEIIGEQTVRIKMLEKQIGILNGKIAEKDAAIESMKTGAPDG